MKKIDIRQEPQKMSMTRFEQIVIDEKPELVILTLSQMKDLVGRYNQVGHYPEVLGVYFDIKEYDSI